MIDLKQLLDEWKDDCKISEMHLDETSRQVPVLHSKYLDKLMNAKLILKKFEFEQKILFLEVNFGQFGRFFRPLGHPLTAPRASLNQKSSGSVSNF